MNALKVFLISSLALTPVVFAKKTDGQFETKIENVVLVLTVKKGFHLNDKAPASIVFDALEAKHKPDIKTEQKFTFKILDNAKKAKLNFYICDDAKTICDQQTPEIDLEKRNPAANQAAEQKYSKTTLLVFSAPWCPACIRLKSETLNTAEVKTSLAKLNVENINIDLVESEKISDQYGVKAIPTIILVNQQGEELKRWLDYQPKKSFSTEIKAALKNIQSVAQLTKKAESGDVAAATELAKNFYSKMQWKDAAKWFSVSKNSKELNYKLASEIQAAQDDLGDTEESKKTYQQALEKGFALTTSRLDQVRWKLDYLEQQQEQKKTIDTYTIKSLQNQLAELSKIKTTKELFAQSTLGDNENFEKTEILDMSQRLLKLIDDKDGVTKIQTKMKTGLDKIKLSTNTPGQMISAIWYYSQASAPEKSESLLKQLIKKYDNSYVYYQKYTSFLVKQKRFDEALAQINLALEHKEGNEPQLNLAKAKILKELGKKEEAVTLIDNTLKLTAVYPTKYKRTQAALEDLKKGLVK